MKKILSIVLCIVMVCSLSVTAFADMVSSCAECHRSYYVTYPSQGSKPYQQAYGCEFKELSTSASNYVYSGPNIFAVYNSKGPICLNCLLTKYIQPYRNTHPTNFSTTVSYKTKGTEAYSVSVPASLAPGGSGDVKVSGTWADNRQVTVSADQKVVLTNDILNTDQKTLKVTFAGIKKTGNNLKAITASDTGCTGTVSVENISKALFGTWKGTFNYTVEISDAEAEELLTQMNS